jgi:hypothetical protein
VLSGQSPFVIQRVLSEAVQGKPDGVTAGIPDKRRVSAGLAVNDAVSRPIATGKIAIVKENRRGAIGI